MRNRPFLKKSAREPWTKRLVWTPELNNYWAGYFDARHKEVTSKKTGITRYKLESDSYEHIQYLRILYPTHKTISINKFDPETSKAIHTVYRFTVNNPIEPTAYDKHYLRGWYDSRFKQVFTREKNQIHLSGTLETTAKFQEAHQLIMHRKAKFNAYTDNTGSARFKLTGKAVDYFLAAIFDESCFNDNRWPPRYYKHFVPYYKRLHPRLNYDKID